MRWVALSIVLGTAAVAFALRVPVAGTATLWLGILLPYTALSVVALLRLRGEGKLIGLFRYRSGDIALGALSAAALLVGSWWGRSSLAPKGTPEAEWLQLIYAQLGDPAALQSSVLLTGALLLIAVEEELVWRGLVLTELGEKIGVRAAWPATALLYAATTLPTLWTLSASTAGLNPLLFFASLGAGIVWSYLAAITGRLLPSMISHAVFTYFSAAQFRIPGMG